MMASRFQYAMTLHIIIFLQIAHLVTGQFKIIPPDNPVIGVIGKGVTLPCQLEAKTTPERLFVQWIFIGKSQRISVTTYDGKNKQNPISEDETYQGRTNFFQTEFNKGNMSLHLKNVMLSDEGKYTCNIFLENWYDEVVVDLNVAAKGDDTSIFLDGHVGQGIGLTCKSQGWFPEPEVVWLDSKGQTRKEKVITQRTKTSSGIFDVVTSMNLEPGSDKEVSCRIVNNLLNTVCESRVLISDVFFPSTSPWMTAFIAILCFSIAVIAAVGAKLKVNTTRRQKAEKNNLEEQLEAQKNTFKGATSENIKQLDRLKDDLDFWEARSHAVFIDVNPDCRVLELPVPGTPKVEDTSSEPAGLNSSSTVSVLVGKEGFASGKHYWEVEVDQQQDWVLGVVREKERQEEEGTNVGEDFWALHRSQGELFSSKENSKIEKKNMNCSVIGVLLDLEEAQVKFYEAGQKNIIVKIPLSLGKEYAEMFYPFLSKEEGIVKPVCHQQKIPVPLKAL
ncbi:butyrophilin subfamily 2 member A1-like isoform X2 [Anas platyrhynchos]|uniref:butyrophilin subfamily 2 member A1-like isoform X2 n=1 Tax=Anas platyrhynchos TaxID=8839 RepID=UPI003AF1ECB0